MTTPITATGATTSPTAAPDSAAKSSMDKDTFLKLLVAQMKYQNPMSPTDPQQWMAQTAQFTMVEKLDSMAKAQAETNQWQRTLSGSLMLGQQIVGRGPDDSVVRDIVVGLQLTAKGPLLELAGGGTIEMDKIDYVLPPPGKQAAAPNVTPAAPTTSTAPATASTPTGSTSTPTDSPTT